MRVFPSVVVGLVCISVLTSCTDINEKANALFVESCQIFEQAKREGASNSYTIAYELYLVAKDNIETILERYPASEIAVGLVANNVTVGSSTLTEFRALDSTWHSKAKHENEPYFCAYLIANIIEDTLWKAWALEQIVLSQSYVWHLADAEHTTQMVLSSISELDNSKMEANLYARVADEFASVEESDKATELLELALRHARSIEEVWEKVRILAQIAVVYDKIGDSSRAAPLLRQCELNITRVKDVLHKVKMMVGVATSYSEIGMKELASSMLSESLRLLLEWYEQEGATEVGSTYDYINAELLVSISKAYSINNELDAAYELIEEIEIPPLKGMALAELCKGYLNNQDTTAVRSLLEQFLEAIEVAYSGQQRVDNLVRAAELMDSIGQNEIAVEILSNTIEAANEGLSKWGQAQALLTIADGYTRLGDFDSAVELLDMVIDYARTLDRSGAAIHLTGVAIGLSRMWDGSNTDINLIPIMHYLVEFSLS